MKLQRQQEAEVRQTEWEKLTPQQQLADLDRRGMTATRQRARIQQKIDKEAK